jgi:hypothetical protein
VERATAERIVVNRVKRIVKLMGRERRVYVTAQRMPLLISPFLCVELVGQEISWFNASLTPGTVRSRVTAAFYAIGARKFVIR